jgi:hypothetical protein
LCLCTVRGVHSRTYWSVWGVCSVRVHDFLHPRWPPVTDSRGLLLLGVVDSWSTSSLKAPWRTMILCSPYPVVSSASSVTRDVTNNDNHGQSPLPQEVHIQRHFTPTCTQALTVTWVGSIIRILKIDYPQIRSRVYSMYQQANDDRLKRGWDDHRPSRASASWGSQGPSPRWALTHRD